MKKIQSLLKKAINLDMAAYQEGKSYYDVPVEERERLAQKRAAICMECPKREKEPIAELRVKDTRLPEISERMCGACSCTLPYLVRQNIKPCTRNQW